MLRPTPGELLAGVRQALAAQVLPELPPGTAARQLRAALHTLAQIEKTWDLLPSYLAADNDDLRESMAELTRLTGISPGPSAPTRDLKMPGVSDPALIALMAENWQLQSELEQTQRAWQTGASTSVAVKALLLELHTRMAARAGRAGGLRDDDH